MFSGSMVALITPMHKDGSIDFAALADLIEWHIESNTQALIIAGTTGESATLEPQEHAELIQRAVKQAAGRIPVIAGTGTNATKSTLRLVDQAKQAGADACLIVTPYYNKPTQNGLYEHYKIIAETSKIPIILYNVPGRTACDMLPETVERLAKIKLIIGIKEATGKIERATEIRARCGQDFAIYSGDDASALALMQAGAKGVISVTANVAPALMQAFCEAALSGENKLAETIDAKLQPLHQRLFIESNPIPTKWALHLLGKTQNGIRLPLLPLDTQYHAAVKEALCHANLQVE